MIVIKTSNRSIVQDCLLWSPILYSWSETRLTMNWYYLQAECKRSPQKRFNPVLIGQYQYKQAGCHNPLQPCSRAARKWRKNEEMRGNGERMRKWTENEEMDREWGKFFLSVRAKNPINIQCCAVCTSIQKDKSIRTDKNPYSILREIFIPNRSYLYLESLIPWFMYFKTRSTMWI